MENKKDISEMSQLTNTTVNENESRDGGSGFLSNATKIKSMGKAADFFSLKKFKNEPSTQPLENNHSSDEGKNKTEDQQKNEDQQFSFKKVESGKNNNPNPSLTDENDKKLARINAEVDIIGMDLLFTSAAQMVFSKMDANEARKEFSLDEAAKNRLIELKTQVFIISGVKKNPTFQLYKAMAFAFIPLIAKGIRYFMNPPKTDEQKMAEELKRHQMLEKMKALKLKEKVNGNYSTIDHPMVKTVAVPAQPFKAPEIEENPQKTAPKSTDELSTFRVLKKRGRKPGSKLVNGKVVLKKK